MAFDRSVPPVGGAIRNFDFPDVERRSLPSGLDLRTARISRLPLVSVNLFMRAGEQSLSPERAGLAVLTGGALEGGTRRRSGSALAEALERLGARLDTGAGWEGTSVSLTCLADRLAEALALLAETVLVPEFPETEVARAREQRLAAIRQRQMDPGSLANDFAPRCYYAATAPYARPLAGTVESVGVMTRAHLAGYADAAYRPGGGGGLVVVGDVDGDEVNAMVTEQLGAWTGSPPALDRLDASPARRERRIWIAHRPGSVQSEIRVGHVGVSRATPDYCPLSVANMLLGGTFTSRLNLNLRERHGFTYGVRSHFSFRGGAGPFEVSTAVGNDVTAPAVREIVAELEKFVADGPTEEEVQATRDFAAGIFGLQLETVGQIATRLTQLVVYGLPDRYFHEYRDSVGPLGSTTWPPRLEPTSVLPRHRSSSSETPTRSGRSSRACPSGPSRCKRSPSEPDPVQPFGCRLVSDLAGRSSAPCPIRHVSVVTHK